MQYTVFRHTIVLLGDWRKGEERRDICLSFPSPFSRSLSANKQGIEGREGATPKKEIYISWKSRRRERANPTLIRLSKKPYFVLKQTLACDLVPATCSLYKQLE